MSQIDYTEEKNSLHICTRLLSNHKKRVRKMNRDYIAVRSSTHFRTQEG